MDKKQYTPPKLNKVKLVIKSSILGTCHASPVMTPKRIYGCNLETACWTGPGH